MQSYNLFTLQTIIYKHNQTQLHTQNIDEYSLFEAIRIDLVQVDCQEFKVDGLMDSFPFVPSLSFKLAI
jgi:hypothetical protein